MFTLRGQARQASSALPANSCCGPAAAVPSSPAGGLLVFTRTARSSPMAAARSASSPATAPEGTIIRVPVRIRRTTPVLLGLCSLVTLLAPRQLPGAMGVIRQAAWSH